MSMRQGRQKSSQKPKPKRELAIKQSGEREKAVGLKGERKREVELQLESLTEAILRCHMSQTWQIFELREGRPPPPLASTLPYKTLLTRCPFSATLSPSISYLSL